MFRGFGVLAFRGLGVQGVWWSFRFNRETGIYKDEEGGYCGSEPGVEYGKTGSGYVNVEASL